ncbi:beta-galactosidase [Erythrobacter sp. SCSIO 43205]|uniref:beta-galactosidase n=1 Tax=Erythrobacter sp. SCSIO 43205 TaxID=2779361 RepID=UPI001CA9ECED|nr:beta-galactosidase [Erythrobacter sp. SCSIO 43205]UAB78078.1 beta-galactosidase [Erythrobacter sp. SCSIO 43205]
MKLGCCYFPEHWPEAMWADDARRMREMGLSLVRIGEFAWSRIEPDPGRFDWGWLDRAIDTLADAGLTIMLCTPTATPPKWLVDTMPDMVAIDADGRPRGFGSRRHYCFSHQGYREQSRRITRTVAERYGKHPAVAAWQTDNEYGCHDTVLSFSDAAAARFRKWCEARYGSIEALNGAWGNVFWSMEYRSFDEIDPPNLTVTEANPAHWLDYRRFASDEVVSFNREQVAILRELSPGRDVTHNFMGFFTEFDHYDVGRDLDVATWDSYPLGFLEQFWFSESEKRDYLRQGHPDIAAFHHDLYRGCSSGRWGVIEQQPGPVNWARFNPAPSDGMVALWTLEAMAHGAEFVSYFRWRQAPFAQEQMHAGLLRPDSADAPAAAEARQVRDVIGTIGAQEIAKAKVALVFSYEAAWVCGIQPQGQSFRYLELVYEWYSALRRRGVDVDIVSPEAPLEGYSAVFIPTLPIVPEGFAAKLGDLACPVLIGPRSGSKTTSFCIPEGLAPGELKELLGLTVTRVESLRNNVSNVGNGFSVSRWLEYVLTEEAPELALDDGHSVVFANANIRYCAAWPDRSLLDLLVERIAGEAGLILMDLPEGIRVRRTASHIFAFNYAAHTIDASTLGLGEPVVGSAQMEPAATSIWTLA